MKCDLLTFPSEEAQRAFLFAPIDKPMHVVPLGIDTSLFQFIERDFESSPFTILHYGVVQPRKGTRLLLDAFLRAFTNEEVKLIVKHWTSWIDWMQTYSVNDPRIKFVNEDIPRGDVPSMLSNAHCLVSPSLAEGFGLTVYEALATGLPVLVSRIPVFRGLLDSRNTRFIEMADFSVPAENVFPISRPGSFRLPSVESLVKWLKRLYQERATLNSTSKYSSEFIRTRFSRELMCKRLVNCIIDARYRREGG
ncbi:MAG: glycosyltransferase family 4 protein, partial [Proteobacteria bacterium]|nr:glycosyltransferase family 4 protein [Pseudomonadota bacterium]